MSYLGHSLMSHYIFAAAGMEYWALFERWEPFRVPEDYLWETQLCRCDRASCKKGFGGLTL